MIKQLLFGRRLKKRHSGPVGARAYAIGDVHGQLNLLVELLAKIEEDGAARAPAKTYIVFLGDLVDRGPDSKGVIDHLLYSPPSFGKSVFLKGNHEEFFIRALGGEEGVVQNWLAYGGVECAESYGLSGGWMLNATASVFLERLIEAVPPAHVAFLRNMADSFRFGDYLFVHAGIRPGVKLEDQSSLDLRWIREGFLDDQTDHGVMVVHGHTIVERPEEHKNRIAIDTGAYRSGKLTAVGLEGNERWFLEVQSDIKGRAIT